LLQTPKGEKVIEIDGGIKLKGMNLWLDATRKKDFAFISHAHTDHARSHSTIIASERTCAFLRQRKIRGKIISLPFDHPMEIERGSVTLFPSGHILGAAQIMIETDGGEKCVYTGDLKVTKGETAERIEVRQCDVLIIEATFGDPHFIFPDREQVIAQLIRFVEGCLGSNLTPVLFAYSLGKAQEVMRVLSSRGYTPVIHPRIAHIAALYEKLGVNLGGYTTWRLGVEDLPQDSVVILPTGARTEAAAIRQKRTAILTGWALDPRLKYRYGVDEAIPLSDHADYRQLVEYVIAAQPRKVYTVHGSPKLAPILQQKGIEARHLERIS